MRKKKWVERAEEYLHRLNGSPRGKKFYRCGHCRYATSLKNELWQYITPPSCKKCGRIDWVIDMGRYHAWKQKKYQYEFCTCGGLAYNHRPGSSVWCKRHPEGPTEEDFKF